MNKNDFMAELTRRLAHLSKNELDNMLSYYSEIIDDRIEEGMNEIEAIASLEDIDTIAGTFTPESEHSVKVYSIPAYEVRVIRFIDSNCAVNIIGEDTTAEVGFDYIESKYKTYDISFSNGVLEVRARFLKRWIGLLGYIYHKPIIITIPRNISASILLETSNAHIYASDINVKGSLALKSSNAHISAVNINTSEGFIMRSSNGRLEAKRLNVANFTAETSNARMEFVQLNSGEEIAASTSNGRIFVDSISADSRISLTSSNSRIHGTIDDSIRNFNIESHTSNASSTLPLTMDGGIRDLRVRTSNGRIDLRFLR